MISHLNILRRQEETTYKCSDYLDPDYQPQWCVSTSSNASSSTMSESWRVKICEWTYNVIDYFNYDRELVFMCMNYLDRYVMKRPLLDTKTYQLAAVTSLFLVVKTFQPRSSDCLLNVSSLVKLSQSTFDEESILAMELEMLAVLQWQLFPPTPYTFAKHLSKFLCFDEGYTQQSHRSRLEIRELTRFFTELSVCDYFFITYNQSTVAMASLLTAINIFVEDRREISPEVRRTFQERIYFHTGLDPSSIEVQECQHRLRAAYVRGGFSNHNDADSDDDPQELKRQQQRRQLQQEAAAEQQQLHNQQQIEQEISIPSPVCVCAVPEKEEDDHLH